MKKRFGAKATCITAALLAVASLPNLTYADTDVRASYRSDQKQYDDLAANPLVQDQRKSARPSSATPDTNSENRLYDFYKQQHDAAAQPDLSSLYPKRD